MILLHQLLKFGFADNILEHPPICVVMWHPVMAQLQHRHILGMILGPIRYRNRRILPAQLRQKDQHQQRHQTISFPFGFARIAHPLNAFIQAPKIIYNPVSLISCQGSSVLYSMSDPPRYFGCLGATNFTEEDHFCLLSSFLEKAINETQQSLFDTSPKSFGIRGISEEGTQEAEKVR